MASEIEAFGIGYCLMSAIDIQLFDLHRGANVSEYSAFSIFGGVLPVDFTFCP